MLTRAHLLGGGMYLSSSASVFWLNIVFLATSAVFEALDGMSHSCRISCGGRRRWKWGSKM